MLTDAYLLPWKVIETPHKIPHSRNPEEGLAIESELIIGLLEMNAPMCAAGIEDGRRRAPRRRGARANAFRSAFQPRSLPSYGTTVTRVEAVPVVEVTGSTNVAVIVVVPEAEG